MHIAESRFSNFWVASTSAQLQTPTTSKKPPPGGGLGVVMGGGSARPQNSVKRATVVELSQDGEFGVSEGTTSDKPSF